MKNTESKISNRNSTINWTEASINGCRVEPLDLHGDERGWLAEFFRRDELPDELHPAMGYVSLTEAGVARGPHAHRNQTDLFVFVHGAFQLYLWDAREDAATYGHRQTHHVGGSTPTRAIVPPGVVHGYRNVGDAPGLIVNCPNRLYAGEGRAEPVDEIRYEERDDHSFKME